MQRTFVVTGLQFQPPNSSPRSEVITKLGVSTIQLVKIADMVATGVRADLQINDPSALNALAKYHADQTGLDWTFEFGGNAQSFTVSLRWTKFSKSTGQIQVVRNVVMRDLISEARPSSAEDMSKAPAPKA